MELILWNILFNPPIRLLISVSHFPSLYRCYDAADIIELLYLCDVFIADVDLDFWCDLFLADDHTFSFVDVDRKSSCSACFDSYV